MDAGARLGYGPLESAAKALLYFFNQVLPAWKAILPRQYQLGITMYQREFSSRQLGMRAGDGVCIAGNDVPRQFLGLLAKGFEGGTIGKLRCGHGDLLS